MTADSALLQSFAPYQLVTWLADLEPSPLTPASKPQEMVVWSADLSGFSNLTRLLTERERAGPEVVSDLLNRTFGQIIELITNYGGGVLDFAGDSVLATWTIDHDHDRISALTLASRCALETVAMDLSQVQHEKSPLALRIAIGVGPGVLMQLGGVEGSWHFLAGGRAFDQIATASKVARPGEVALSKEAAEAIGSDARGFIDQEGILRLGYVPELEPPGPATRPEVTPVIAEQLRHFLSPLEAMRVDLGHTDWLAEFRQVTSLFINLPTLDLLAAPARDSLQDVVARAQRALAKYEGTLRQVLDDEKGVTLVASFGLPQLAHEEDPYLAVQAAEEIQSALIEMKLEYGIGVATGRAFCGICGSPERRTYTTIGPDVNLAARLMQAARFEVLCDEATALAATRIEFVALGDRQVRGWDRPILAFRPLWERVGGQAGEQESVRLVGRENEQNHLVAWLGALVRAHSSAIVVVEGGAGIGKTALAADLLRTAKSFDVRTLLGAALPVAQAPYQAWREVIAEVLGLTSVRSLDRRQEIVRQRLSAWPEFSDWEPLLNSVLDLQFPETTSTRGMSGSNRRASTVELLVALLAEAATESPLLIVLDDLHWFDSGSWAVTLAVASKVSPLLMVLLTRPMLKPPEALDELTGLGTSARLVLEPIGEQDALKIARERLGANELSPEAAKVIVEAAEGIPFFIEELVYSLRDTGALVVEDGTVKLTLPAADLGIPHTLTSVVLGRIDRLEPQLQLLLKVASVIGRSFDTRVLEAVNPAPSEVGELQEVLSELVGLDLIVESSPGSYDFKHALIREAAYEMLSFDQRRRIHRSVAMFMEGLEAQDPLYALLAHHWEQAGDHPKALFYFEKTGASALRKGANQEAIEAHSKSLELVHQSPREFDDVSDLRRSQWHVEIGQAYEALGSFDQAEASFYRALDLVNVHVPSKRLERVGRLIREAMLQLVHIALPGTIRVPQSHEEKGRLGQGALVSALLAEIYFFKGDLVGFPLLCLVSINLGEKAGEPLLAGLAYSNFGYLVGTLRLRGLARRYFRRARRAEELETNPAAADLPSVVELQEMGPGHLIAVALAESVLALTFDEWTRARELATEGLERCNQLGDKYSAGIALAVRGFVSYSSGHLGEALDDYTQLLASARARSNREHEGWARSFVVPVLLARNELEDAQRMTDAAMAILDQVDPLTVPVIHGTGSQARLRVGAIGEARASAEQALETIDSTPIFIYLAGFAGFMDTLLELWEAEPDPTSAGARELSELTRRGLKKMKTFALVLPFARPKYYLFKGRTELLEGRISRARRSIQKGIELAKNSGFRWDEGLLHLELARMVPADSRAPHLSEAEALFQAVGSYHDLGRVEPMSA
jgi:class 3 adenylate cyclase/tetratricopeptide (TPR) repeat protein